MQNTMTAATSMSNMNSQMMIDNLKSMMLTMAMVKGSNQNDSQNSFRATRILEQRVF